MDRSVKMVPSLDGHPIVRQTACLRPVSPDRLPIIGPVPGLDGTYLATAAEKKGILIGPAIGNAISDLVITGETDIPIASFQITRF
jgi:sarcosine oxidase subunit beta